MIIRLTLIFLAVLFVFVPVISFGFTPTLNRDLVVGSTGVDVWSLQRWLNRNGFKLASFGPGAPDFETNYFGPLTKTALAKYQVFKGITPATGHLDFITRSKITGGVNIPGLPKGCTSVAGYSPLTGIKCDNKPKNEPKNTIEQSPQLSEPSGFSLPTAPSVSETMAISSISPTSGRAGTQVTISGYGFDAKDNLVYTGFSQEKVDSSDGQSLRFKINPSFSADLDLHIYVVSQSGRSNDLIFKLKQ